MKKLALAALAFAGLVSTTTATFAGSHCVTRRVGNSIVTDCR